jgi:predicted DNA binding CopG/RHH family protein
MFLCNKYNMINWLSYIVNNMSITNNNRNMDDDMNNDMDNDIYTNNINKMSKSMIAEHNKKWVKIIRNNTFC